MWKEQTPRQVYELLESYRRLNDDSEREDKPKTYKTKGKKKVKIPDWYTVPEGAEVYHADDVTHEDIYG
jgi:hypothetical protein